jgi:hypothetical protein
MVCPGRSPTVATRGRSGFGSRPPTEKYHPLAPPSIPASRLVRSPWPSRQADSPTGLSPRRAQARRPWTRSASDRRGSEREQNSPSSRWIDRVAALPFGSKRPLASIIPGGNHPSYVMHHSSANLDAPGAIPKQDICDLRNVPRSPLAGQR